MPPKIVLHVVPHTHWDREWYEPFEAYRFRLVKVVDQLLETLDDDPGFRHFHFDGQTAAIEDYLEVRPPVGPEVERFIRDGRLAIGPWRILMDEFLCSPETIIRNIQQGTSRARAMGGSAPLGYIPDSFGHIAQMPQILRLAGLSDACVWRGVPFAVDRTAFVWEAPDGSTVRTMYLATSYSNGATLPESADALLVRAERIVEDITPFKPNGVVLVMNGTDHRGPETHLPAVFAEANARQDAFEFRLGSMAEYLREAPSDGLPRWKGELRSGARANLLMGVVSARMPLKQAEMRASIGLERYAEPLSALAGTDTGRLLERAWRGMVENSAHDSICGCGVDAVADQVAARYVEAERIAELVARDAIETLVARADASHLHDDVDGVFVFDPAAHARGGVAEIRLAVDRPGAVSFATTDGTVLAAQPIGEPERQILVDMTLDASQLARIVPTIHSRMIGDLTVNALEIEQGRVTQLRLRLGAASGQPFDIEAAKRDVEQLIARKPRGRFHVVAEGPPLCSLLVEAPHLDGLGWSVLAQRPGSAAPADPVTVDERTIRNSAIEATVDDDGSVTILHRASGTRYERALMLVDDGDAGDEYNYSPPLRQTIVSQPDAVEVAPGNAGPLEASLAIRRRYRVPVSLSSDRVGRHRKSAAMETVTTIALRSGESFLRVTLDMENRSEDHRLRVIVPLPFRPERSDAESAFAVVARGRDAESGPHEYPLPTFPSRRWVDASDGERGIAILHRGTPEYELVDEGIALTVLRCVGRLSGQDMSYRAGPAGPPLPAPGAQLLGSHRFEFALYPHQGGWRSGEIYHAAERFTLPLRHAVVRAHTGSLPATATGIAIAPPSVQLSALINTPGGIELRIFNAADEAVEAVVMRGPTLPRGPAAKVDLFGNELAACDGDDERIRSPLVAWEIATIRVAATERRT